MTPNEDQLKLINDFIGETGPTYSNEVYPDAQQESIKDVRRLFNMLLFEMETFSVTKKNQSTISDIITRIKRENVAINRNNKSIKVHEFIEHLTKNGHKKNVENGIKGTYKILEQVFKIYTYRDIREGMVNYENEYKETHKKPMLHQQEMVVPLIDTDMEIFYNNLSAREEHVK